MLSVFSTLKEAFHLWVQNFWYLAGLTLAVFLPIFGIKYIEQSMSDHGSLAFIVIKSFDMFFDVFATIMEMAFILGLLQQVPTKKPFWLGIWSTIKISTAPLLGALLLLWGISVVFVVLVYMLIHFFDRDNLLLLLLIWPVFGCILFKYALTPPIIVRENLGPWTALCRSWKMTRGHFWYVGGNCLFLGGAAWLIHYMIGTHVRGNGAVMTGVTIVLNLGYCVFSQLWVILLWCMYLRIKETEEPSRRDASTLAGG